mmetsp:Transcript_110122/g.351291  ORF Transcript_110122/g.351291 Transcript_110122/m.351291 type:complete len:510 (+) Transcript_110122:473-2002(+)
MRLGNLLHAHEASLGDRLGGKNLQPGQDCPHAVLLADMVAAGAKGLLPTDERRVRLAIREVVRSAVHQIAKELPARGDLEVRQALLGGDKIQRTGGGHGSRTTLEAASLLELGDEVRVGHDDGQGIRGRHEELRPQDHVPVGVSIGTRAEGGDRLPRADLLAFGVEPHGLHELHGVGQVRVRVAVPGRGGATKIGLRSCVGARTGLAAEGLLQDLLGVRPLDAAHGVVDEGEVGPGKELLDLVEVKALLEEFLVVLHGIEDFDDAVTDRVASWLAEVDVRDAIAHFDLRDARGELDHLVRHLLGRRPSVLAVVLDPEVLGDPAGVVGGGADEAAEGLEAPAAASDHGGDGGRGQETVGPAPDPLHAVRQRDLDDDLDGLRVPVAAVAGDDEGAALHRHALRVQRIENALDEVVQVVALHEDLRLLAEAGRPWFLPVNGRRGKAAHLQRAAHWHRVQAQLHEAFAGIRRRTAELLLDAEELVVLGQPLRPARRASLDLAGPEANNEVSDE